jgi:ribose 5-phosphate isomerase B
MAKSFDIITEGDARALTPGESVTLARHGHVTPLAADTLRERRITVIREGEVPSDVADLVPVADIKVVAVASDHSGLSLRKALTSFLRSRGLTVIDLGTSGPDPVDYPDTAALVAEAVARREADAGLVLDGAGIGSAIAANKVPGVRAVMATTETVARYSREHNGANVLTLGATLVTQAEAQAIVTMFLSTPMHEPRYVRRLEKIRDLEQRARRGDFDGYGR